MSDSIARVADSTLSCGVLLHCRQVGAGRKKDVSGVSFPAVLFWVIGEMAVVMEGREGVSEGRVKDR